MKNICTLTLVATASLMIALAPVQAANTNQIDPVTTGSTEKPVKDGKKLYPVNALEGLNL